MTPPEGDLADSVLRKQRSQEKKQKQKNCPYNEVQNWESSHDFKKASRGKDACFLENT
jgi:hypothetical protein